MKINIKGPVISDGEQWIYDWFGIPAISPGKVSNLIDSAVRNHSKELIVVINSGGGSVFSASDIYTSLKSFKGEVNVEIVGVAASAASVIAMAGTKVSMSPTAQLMIHNASTGAWGDYRDMDYTSDFLQNVNKSIMNAYTIKTGKKEAELKNMMDNETWMTAQQALEYGFIDSIMFEEGRQAVANLEIPNLKNGLLPPEVIEKVRNELLKDKGHSITQMTTTMFEPVALAGQTVEKAEKEGDEKTMNLEELKNNHPDLYNQIREEGFQEGIKAENNRIKSIEDLSIAGSEDLVNKAKFETNETAEQLAVNILKAQKQQGVQYLENRKEDAAKLDKVPGSSTPEANNEEDERASVVNSMAQFINKKRGGVK